MQSVASEASALSHRHPHGPRQPASPAPAPESPFATLLDSAPPAEDAAKPKEDAAKPKEDAVKPKEPTTQAANKPDASEPRAANPPQASKDTAPKPKADGKEPSAAPADATAQPANGDIATGIATDIATDIANPGSADAAVADSAPKAEPDASAIVTGDQNPAPQQPISPPQTVAIAVAIAVAMPAVTDIPAAIADASPQANTSEPLASSAKIGPKLSGEIAVAAQVAGQPANAAPKAPDPEPGQKTDGKSADGGNVARADAKPAADEIAQVSASDGHRAAHAESEGKEQRQFEAADAKPHAADLPVPADTSASAPASAAKANADPSLLISAPASHTASPNAAASAASPLAPAGNAVPLAGLAVEITAQAQAGRNRFSIRLDPPELGRIDVRLDVDRDGHVTSRLVVERPETLDLLRRDAAGLERALQDAGLKTGDNAPEFSLRGEAFARQDNGREATPAAAQIIVPDADAAPVEAQRGYGRLLGLGGGLDIRV